MKEVFSYEAIPVGRLQYRKVEQYTTHWERNTIVSDTRESGGKNKHIGLLLVKYHGTETETPGIKKRVIQGTLTVFYKQYIWF
jgi:hypothetical protein